jgi:serine/threonine protein kinase
MEQPRKCPSCGKQMPGGVAFCPWDGHALEPGVASAPLADPLLELQVSEYVIKEHIGAGGMGIVYRAVQPLIGKQVAIKVMKEEFAASAELVERLLVEARVVNSIRHKGIIDIFGFGQLPDGRPYMVMELLQGMSLDRFVRRKRKLGTDEAVEILEQMLSALGAAHRAGVIHRDLKPGNVFLVEEPDGTRTVKLLDFGIAKVLESRGPRPLTVEGSILGTPAYMAPEQLQGKKVGPGADLYAVGVIAFQLLSGKLPFAGDEVALLRKKLEENPPALSSLVPDVPEELESIVQRLLARNPSKRFTSADAVRRELGAFIDERALAETDVLGSPPLVGPKSPELGPPTIEVPMLAAVPEVAATPSSVARTDVGPSRAASPRWLMGAGAAALILSAGIVGAQVLRPAPAAEEAKASAPAGQAVAPQPATTVAAASIASSSPVSEPAHPESEKAPSLAAKSTPKPSAPAGVSRRPASVVKTVAPRPTATAASGATATRGLIDQKSLLAQFVDAEARLLEVEPKACPLSSPAMARLKDLQKQAQQATSEENRTKVATLLKEWEQKFLSAQQRVSPPNVR